ncbi:MAG: exodeoxyribonuclease V subunit gamma [Myxococcota bacterium]
MIRLTYSNATEALVGALVEWLEVQRARGRSVLMPVDVIVPNRNMERFLELSIAQSIGIAANFRFHRLERFVSRWLARGGQRSVFDRRSFERGILSALLDDDWLSDPVVAPLAHYVAADERATSEVRRAQLALRLARLFEGYGYSRPEMLLAWRENRGDVGETEGWQRALYQRLIGRGELPLPEALPSWKSGAAGDGLPDAVHVFGLSYVARVFQWAFAALGARTDLHLYVLNPCMEFWEDVPTRGELAARLPRRARTRVGNAVGELEALPQIEHAGGDDPPALTWWGRPGREHVHLLNELTGADFEPRFADPGDASVLRALQRDVLHREPERTKPTRLHDGSVQGLACPGVRREVEVVAEEIWRLVQESDPARPLRFNEIAVFVHADARDLYLPHVASVFAEAGDLPHHVVDLPLTAESQVAEAAMRLLDLMQSRFRRPDVLGLLLHPSLRLPARAADRSRWTRLVDLLGAFHGLSHKDHEGTYIDRDVINWDQAVRRLCLGAFLDDERPAHWNDESYLPQSASSDEGAVALAMLLRSLLSDADFARAEERSLADWARFIDGLFRGYLAAETPRQETELRRCLAAAHGLAERDRDGRPVGYAVAAELVRQALAGLGGARGEYLTEGVVVSALTPMRAVPFRVAFLLGMGEGTFPTSERRDPLDLRARKRRVGDVTPIERDKYMFLETLLCARERLYCSWVSRDALTGDPIEPSAVLRQLFDLLGRGYVRDSERLIRHHPLRRYQEPPGRRALPEAGLERQAAKWGDQVRQVLHRDLDAHDLQILGKDPRVSRLLALPVPPKESDAERTVRVSLADLRRFLEAPLQGWARAVLRLGEDTDAERAAREDEPFAPSGLDTTTALRACFVEGLRERRPPKEIYPDEIQRLQAHGRWPVGTLAERQAESDHKTLTSWQRIFRNAVAPGGMTPKRIRFGASPNVTESDVVLSPIRLSVPVRGKTLDVELTGRTEVLLEEGRASLVLIPGRAPKGVALQRTRLFYALRGFFDFLALVASGGGREAHRAIVLYGGEAAQDASTHFRGLDERTATAYLEALLGDLLAGPHAYFLPCEAVFRDPSGYRTMTGHRLLDHAAFVRRSDGGGRSRFGPIADAPNYPLPSPEDALAMMRRRFELFFRLVGLAG